MKRQSITADIERHLRASLGADADLSKLAVYEAIALNTLPLRKNHPLYKNARTDRGILFEMATELSRESRPMYIEHRRGEDLPVGRVFHGAVVDGQEAELRVLFFIDGNETEAVTKVESGVVDQVSVSIMPKQILNSVSGFDYLGPDSDFENIMSGTDPDGNTLNEKGCYARLVGLSNFFELSLVGMGGAQNARIVRRDESHFGSSFPRLAASGVDPNALVLTAQARIEDMDLTALSNQLVALSADKTKLEIDKAALESQVTNLSAKITELETKVTTLSAGDKDSQITALSADLSVAKTALTDVAKALLTKAGKVTEAPPEGITELTTMISDTTVGLAAALVAGGISKPADSAPSKPSRSDLAAFATL